MRDPQVLAEVKEILLRLAKLSPGHAVEVRVPPYSAIQCVTGSRHTRGTPPNVVELNYETLTALIDGSMEWQAGISSGAIHASGDKADLSLLFAELARMMSGED
jgi:hypothetical protein